MMLTQRQLQDDDWQQFKSFCREYIGPSHNNNRAFNEHWFKTGRENGWNAQVLVDSNGDIRGVTMYILVNAKFGDEILPLAWSSTTVLRNFEQEKGAGARLYLWIYRRFPLVGAMSGNKNSLPISATLGQEIPGVKMNRFIRVHDPEKASGLCLPENRNVVLDIDWGHNGDDGGLTTNWLDLPPDDYDGLWKRFRKTVFFSVERDRSHMVWRYVDAPFISYKFLEMREHSGTLKALAVIRFQPTPVGEVWRIMEFIADDDMAAQGWSSIAKNASARGVVFSDFMVIGSRQDEYLREAGFILSNDVNRLDALPNLLSPPEHRHWSNTIHFGGNMAKKDQRWRSPDGVYFTKGDSDRDWPTMYDLKRMGIEP